MIAFIERIKKNVDIDRKIVLTLLILECFIKNTPFIKLGNYPIYIVCLTSFLVLVKRLIFNQDVIFRKQNFFAYLFILSITITAIFNNALFNYNNIVIFIIFVIMFFIVSIFDGKESISHIINEFVFMARITIVLHLIYSIASIYKSIYICDFEIKGLIEYPYFYAYNCVTVIGLSIFLYLYENCKVIKYTCILNLILHLIIVFFTQTRAAYLGIFVAMIFIIYIFYYNSFLNIEYKNVIKYILLLLVFVTILIIIFSLKTNFNITNIIIKVFNTNNILSWRDIIWEVSFFAFLTGNVFIGSSIGILPSFLSNYINNVYINNISYDSYSKIAYDSALGVAKAGNLHNVFIQHLCSYGIFGFILIIAYILDGIKKYINIIKSKVLNDKPLLYLTICFAFTFIAQIVISFFDNNLFYNIIYICNVFFFYSIGIINYISL